MWPSKPFSSDQPSSRNTSLLHDPKVMGVWLLVKDCGGYHRAPPGHWPPGGHTWGGVPATNGPQPELPGRIQVGPCWRGRAEGKAPRMTWRETEEAQAAAGGPLWAGAGAASTLLLPWQGGAGPRRRSGLDRQLLRSDRMLVA